MFKNVNNIFKEFFGIKLKQCFEICQTALILYYLNSHLKLLLIYLFIFVYTIVLENTAPNKFNLNSKI